MKTIIVLTSLILCSYLLSAQTAEVSANQLESEITNTLKKQTLKQARKYLKAKPITVTAETSERSAGGIHDFYSEGDYWWPDSENPDGPYIRRDGETNPKNFTAHRLAMIRFSKLVGTLTSAFLLTKNDKYAHKAVEHLNAWFVNEQTKMNPSLLYAQAIKGRVTGRGIGIIDMIQMVEVAQSIRVLERENAILAIDLTNIKQWFSDYLTWVTTHPYGIDERDTKNNHATCWVMQVAAFAKLTNNTELLNFCSTRFKTVLLPNQMATDGSFPLEMSRTKPYGYALFNLDAMTTVCQILSTNEDNLWLYTTSEGKNIRQAIEFMHPFVEDKSTWNLPPDVMYYNNWPVAHPFLIFGTAAYKKSSWLFTWQNLEHFPKTQEVIRNLPVRHPIIWLIN